MKAIRGHSSNYFVEISHPPYPNVGKKVRVLKKPKNYNWNEFRETLSCDMVSLKEVSAFSKEDAIAKAILDSVDMKNVY